MVDGEHAYFLKYCGCCAENYCKVMLVFFVTWLVFIHAFPCMKKRLELLLSATLRKKVMASVATLNLPVLDEHARMQVAASGTLVVAQGFAKLVNFNLHFSLPSLER